MARRKSRVARRKAQGARRKTQGARHKTQGARRKTQDARRKTQDARRNPNLICALEPAPWSLRPEACALKPAPCALEPAPWSLRPGACALRPAACENLILRGRRDHQHLLERWVGRQREDEREAVVRRQRHPEIERGRLAGLERRAA